MVVSYVGRSTLQRYLYGLDLRILERGWENSETRIVKVISVSPSELDSIGYESDVDPNISGTGSRSLM